MRLRPNVRILREPQTAATQFNDERSKPAASGLGTAADILKPTAKAGMKSNRILELLRLQEELIATSGQAQFVRTPTGESDPNVGTTEDRANAGDWMAMLLPAAKPSWRRRAVRSAGYNRLGFLNSIWAQDPLDRLASSV